MTGAEEFDRALRAAEGHGATQDWNAALEYAAAAAEAGHTLARASLAALAGDWEAAKHLQQADAIRLDWGALRRRIDIAALLRMPPPQILSAAPRIAIVEGLASAPMCDWLVARARNGLAPAQVYDPKGGGATHHGVRTNRERPFLFADRDLVFALLRHRIARATGLPVAAMEAPTILHYQPGQEFQPHHDYLEPAHDGYAKDIAARGQRVLTFLVCLNDGYEGGQTEFAALGKRFKGKRGNALFFWNVEPDGRPDPRTLHAGLPPTSGEKWMFSQWVRDRAA